MISKAFPSTTFFFTVNEKLCFDYHNHSPTFTKKVVPRKFPDTLLRRGESSGYMTATPSPCPHPMRHVVVLDIPARWDDDLPDRQAGAGDEREHHTERTAHGGLEEEPEDRVKDKDTCC
jgi:hypothetical protein